VRAQQPALLKSQIAVDIFAQQFLALLAIHCPNL
jgi:hypothetical protein